MGNDLILKGGLIATARSVREGDVLIRDGRIAGTGPGLRAEGARVIDCTGRLVSAGFMVTSRLVSLFASQFRFVSSLFWVISRLIS